MGHVPAGLSNIIAIAAGGFKGGSHNLALRSNGTVVVWGANNWGQTNLPPSATNVVAITASGGHSLALRANGTIVGWGYNNYGQASPPPGLSNVVAIAAGAFHSLAVRTDKITLKIGFSNNVAALTFHAFAGQNYSVEYRTNITFDSWHPLSGGFIQGGNNEDVTVADSALGSGQRFYRTKRF